jgi:hypothetical protein
MRQIGVKVMDCSAELCHWEYMTQPLNQNDRRAVAMRLFKALCAKKYIALIQPRDANADRLPAPDLTAVESSAAS